MASTALGLETAVRFIEKIMGAPLESKARVIFIHELKHGRFPDTDELLNNGIEIINKRLETPPKV